MDIFERWLEEDEELYQKVRSLGRLFCGVN
jgi:hypothetical protein